MKNQLIKKTITLLFILLCLFFVSRRVQPQDKTVSEDGFHIYQSYIIGVGSDKRTFLRVIRYDKDIDIEDLFEKIRDFHDRMNGESSELVIYLYDSKEDLLSGNKLIERVYYIDDSN